MCRLLCRFIDDSFWPLYKGIRYARRWFRSVLVNACSLVFGDSCKFLQMRVDIVVDAWRRRRCNVLLCKQLVLQSALSDCVSSNVLGNVDKLKLTTFKAILSFL